MDAVAANDGNKIGALTCAAEQGNTQFGMGVLTVVNWLGSGLLGQAAQIDTSDLHYQTTAQSNDTATVHMTGQLRAAILGLWQTQEQDSSIKMVVEDGRWKYCGSV
jgi:hypothetical protein